MEIHSFFAKSILNRAVQVITLIADLINVGKIISKRILIFVCRSFENFFFFKLYRPKSEMGFSAPACV